MEPTPRVPPLDRPATYEDLMQVPDVMVAEIVDGELHVWARLAAGTDAAPAEGGLLLDRARLGV